MALITRAAAAKMLGIGVRTLERYDSTGEGPGFVRVGPRLVRYDPEVCRSWASARTYPHRAAEIARGTTPKQKAPAAG
ncbi:helix-turn-helix transcriptional regulator [Enterovirga rhinocerotis]|uniref:AlpA family transcriptional regulator n=1 Tax=Enterovirga rhinocerotis TaxID=1339210 RepID=A0A4R7CFE1_9HYPH|nr:transcriptional regulator [Enterovirga rhinocerotis]TDR95673.1 hypothetical protein EV668_0057 [Enterovirga rhinocerotis]